MIWLSSDLRFKWLWLSIDSGFKWFGCQMIWDSNDLVVNRCVIQMILVVSWLRFKWVGCQLIWDLIDLVVRRFGCQLVWDSIKSVISFSARLPSKMKLWSSKTKLFCETSFKIEILKLQKRFFSARFPSKFKLGSSKNEAFVRDFLQKWSFEAPKHFFLRDFLQFWNFEAAKRCFSARFPSKFKLGSSKNEAFLRDFFQKWSFEAKKRSLCARLPSKMTCWADTWPHNSNTFQRF